MKRKISILSLVFFITSLVTPINSVSATEVDNENSQIIITEDIDNTKEEVIEDTLESDELTSNKKESYSKLCKRTANSSSRNGRDSKSH